MSSNILRHHPLTETNKLACYEGSSTVLFGCNFVYEFNDAIFSLKILSKVDNALFCPITALFNWLAICQSCSVDQANSYIEINLFFACVLFAVEAHLADIIASNRQLYIRPPWQTPFNSGAPNENIVQNHLNIASLNVF